MGTWQQTATHGHDIQGEKVYWNQGVLREGREGNTIVSSEAS